MTLDERLGVRPRSATKPEVVPRKKEPRELDDPYLILGIPRTASYDAVRRRYRERVKEYAPDTHPDDPHAHQNMQMVTLAHEILTDPEKRREFDIGNRDIHGKPIAWRRVSLMNMTAPHERPRAWEGRGDDEMSADMRAVRELDREYMESREEHVGSTKFTGRDAEQAKKSLAWFVSFFDRLGKARTAGQSDDTTSTAFVDMKDMLVTDSTKFLTALGSAFRGLAPFAQVHLYDAVMPNAAEAKSEESHTILSTLTDIFGQAFIEKLKGTPKRDLVDIEDILRARANDASSPRMRARLMLCVEVLHKRQKDWW